MATAYLIDDGQSGNGFNWAALATITGTNFNADELGRVIDKRQSSVLQGTAKTGLEITFDLGSALAVTVFAILGHIFTSSATITILADDDPAFGSPGVNLNPTWDEQQIIHVFSSPQSYRYWRLTVDDATNPYLPWMGEILIGQLLQFTHPQTWGHTEVKHFNNVTLMTDYGIRWNYSRAENRRTENLNFLQRPDTEAAEIETFFNNARGSLYPVLLILDDSELDRSIYGHLVDDLGRNFNFIEWNNFANMNIQEQPIAQRIRKV